MCEAELLGQKVEVLNGFAFPSSGFTTEDGLPLVRIRDIASGQTEVNFRGKFDPAYLLANGDVLIGMDGDFLVSRWSGGDALLNQRVCKVTSISSEVDQRFLYWFLQPHIEDIHRKTPQTTVRHLSTKDVRAVPSPAFVATQQSKIAEVLDTLDAAIRGTEAVVAKLKAMKQGLLHDLLTRGIDANGDLRPPHTKAPHLYKETPLGWLPKEWEVSEIQNMLASVDPAMRSGPFGSALLKDELVEEGVPFLGIDNVFVERFDRNFKRFVTPGKFLQLQRYAVRPDDLMITIMGTVGRCCLVPLDVGRALSSKHTWTISLDEAKYSPYLAMLQVNYSDWVLRHFSKDQQGGTMSAIRSETIRSTLLPVPPRDEQEAIAAILSELSRRLREEQTSFEKLRLQKSGLMDDLLTGRVPVTPLLDGGTAHGA
ncbi:restriction endonuclease subunit S [Phaeobacter inhibens]|uniref:restriction endonuclease subunit S n=1 Tax=Phaeobacter inhibens TaxID=221822 RepID=UPI0001632EBB|nr:restriction endonuclease subunit S [Phaeobacter inhibens]AFO92721.1 putative type I restriction-modification system, S subunit [Phaeobacter inhibens DSM 17395]AUQ47425.1 putative type I restriction-modification system, S subunit [Phaeobacter inhibens]AXT24030.1 restriction endonuclease subunit S [Phaeobacter inhibens]